MIGPGFKAEKGKRVWLVPVEIPDGVRVKFVLGVDCRDEDLRYDLPVVGPLIPAPE